MYVSPGSRLSRKCEVENESLQLSEIRRLAQESAPRKHRDLLLGAPVTLHMDVAIKRLINGRITRDALLDLFDQRASHAAIKAWRYGWRGAPQWAVDLIQGKLAAQAAADIAAGAKLKPSVGMDCNKGARALAAWRERKARERDEKEKAARDGAASGNSEPE